MSAITESRDKILKLFVEAFNGNDNFTLLDGVNPCQIIYNGKYYNVYIKNLTPAQLSNGNENVWRIQLPKREAFESIKDSEQMFLLLGYDADADVYATWNPYWAKQRLNIGESVSLYSRKSLQEEACVDERFIVGDLNHNGKVVIFPREKIGEYIDNIKKYFPVDNEYIAIGSSLRKGKQEQAENNNNGMKLFTMFSNPNNIEEFKNYLFEKGGFARSTTASHYLKYIRFVFDNDLWNKNRSLFLNINDIEDYKAALIRFVSLPTLAEKDKLLHRGIRATLMKYYEFIKGKLECNPTKARHYPKSLSSDDLVQETHSIYSKFPEIKDDSVITKVRGLMSQDPAQTLASIQVVSQYYEGTGMDVNNIGIKDWYKFVENTDWMHYGMTILGPKPIHQEKESKKSDSTRLKVTFSDGEILDYPKSSQTFVKAIEKIGVKKVYKLDLHVDKVNVVSKTPLNVPNSRWHEANGWFVNSHSATSTKYNILTSISNRLGLKIKVELI